MLVCLTPSCLQPGTNTRSFGVSRTRVGVSNTLSFAAGDEDKSLVYIFPKKTTLKHRLGTDDALFVDFIGTFHARVFEGVAKSHLRIKAIVCKSPKRRCLSFSLNLTPPSPWRGTSAEGARRGGRASRAGGGGGGAHFVVAFNVSLRPYTRGGERGRKKN